jgi:hypothetical protein
LVLVLALSLAAACESADDRARVEFSTRLTSASRLTSLEMTRLMEETNRAIEHERSDGRKMQLHSGDVSHEADDKDRSELTMLLGSQPSIVEDGGTREVGGAILRGILGPATPVQSELEVTAGLWIDVATFLPRRYEVAHGGAGDGDYAYDVRFER